MKKPKRRLVMQHETLRLLEEKQLVQAAGGTTGALGCPTVPHHGVDTTPG
jgi:hypothetical protein